MSKQERIAFYKEQVQLENKIVEKAEKTVRGMENILIRELILGIALDSKKHASMLNALISMYTKPTPSIAEEFGDDLRKAIAEHIELEQQAVETYQEKLETTDNESERLIIRAILNDEKKHHKNPKNDCRKINSLRKGIMGDGRRELFRFWRISSYIPYFPYFRGGEIESEINTT